MTRTDYYLQSLLHRAHTDAECALNNSSICWKLDDLQNCDSDVSYRLRASLGEWALDQIDARLRGGKVDWLGVEALVKMRNYYKLASEICVPSTYGIELHARLFDLTTITERMLFRLEGELKRIDRYQEENKTSRLKNHIYRPCCCKCECKDS